MKIATKSSIILPRFTICNRARSTAYGNLANDNTQYAGTLSTAERQEFARKLQESIGLLADRLLASDEAVSLGHDIRERAVYTSKSYQNREAKICSAIDNLCGESRSALPSKIVADCIASQEKSTGYSLSADQRLAIDHVTGSEAVSVVWGRAGTGKTTMLAPVAQAYRRAGYRVLGAAALGKAVDVMEREIGIESHTLDRYRIAWMQHAALVAKRCESGADSGIYNYIERRLEQLRPYQLGPKDVMIVDEANMVGSHLWHALLSQVEASGAKLIVVQDPQQLKSVGTAGDIGAMLIDKCGAAELNTIYRQKVDWQIEASRHFNDHNVSAGLALYHEKQRIVIATNKDSAKWAVVESYLQDRDLNRDLDRDAAPGVQQMVLAFRNSDVKDLNHMIRHQLIMRGELVNHFTINGQEYSIGDKIVFEKNDHQLVQTTLGSKVREAMAPGMSKPLKQGIKNGQVGTIVSYANSELRVVLDGENREVRFNSQSYQQFSHGYAMTIHKSEGETTDKSYLLLDSGMDANLLLVGATRHRQDLRMFASGEQFADVHQMASRMSRSDRRFGLEDYTISDANRPYFERMQQFVQLSCEKHDILDQISDKRGNQDSLWQSFTAHNEQLKELSQEIISDWSSHQKFASQLNLRKDVFEVTAGLRLRALSDLEVQAANGVQEYFGIAKNVRELWNEIRQGAEASLNVKEHNLYAEYEDLRQVRNHMANDMAAHPKLYQSLIKTALDNGQFKDVLGALYDSKPGSWAGVIKHSQQFIDSQKIESYKSKLSDNEMVGFNQLAEYKEQCSKVASLVSKLKHTDVAHTSMHTSVVPAHVEQASLSQNNLTLSKLLDALETAQNERNNLALEIVTNPGQYQPHFDRLNIDESKLLDYAIREESIQISKTSQSSLLPQPSILLNYEPEFKSTYDADKVLAAANDKLELIACELLGAPNQALSSAKEYRFGHSGKIVYTRTGPSTGLWHDFSSGEGGNIFQLVGREIGGKFPDHIRYVADRVGYDGEQRFTEFKTQSSSKYSVEQPSIDKTAQVQQQYDASLPITGTPAEAYLRTHRGIATAELPQDIRYIPQLWNGETQTKMPALIAFARNELGEITGRQAIYLDSTTSAKACVERSKISYGLIKGSCIEIQSGKDITFIAEGIETALSLKEAGIDGRIVASLGISNMRNLHYTNQKIVICADNDGPDSKTADLINKTALQLQNQDKQVHVVRPSITGHDYNDVLQTQGPEAVRDSIYSQTNLLAPSQVAAAAKTDEHLTAVDAIRSHQSANRAHDAYSQLDATGVADSEQATQLQSATISNDAPSDPAPDPEPGQDMGETQASIATTPSPQSITTMEQFTAFLETYELDDSIRQRYLNAIGKYDMADIAELISIDETLKALTASDAISQNLEGINLEDIKIDNFKEFYEFLSKYDLDNDRQNMYILALKQYDMTSVAQLVSLDETLKETHLNAQTQQPSPFVQFRLDLDRYALSESDKADYMTIAVASVDYAKTTLSQVNAQIKTECDEIYQASNGELSENTMNALVKDLQYNLDHLSVERVAEKSDQRTQVIESISKQLEPYMEYLSPDIQERVEAIKSQEQLKTQEIEQERTQQTQKSWDMSL